MEKTYNPKLIEQALYEHWESAGYFQAHSQPTDHAYSIMIPPPNVTGSLHMGHAFQDTIMDTLIRCQRMRGKNTLWQVGTDHAGIATQMVVERQIAAQEQKTKHDYGREAFIDKIWQWKETSGGQITQQLRRLGASVDWQRERFTMDAGFSQAVQEVFIQLYKDDLIYRGKRLVNWDPKLHTAISDLEVENKDKQGHMWRFRYPLAEGVVTAEGKNYLVVATTRPETMLGDTAVAVNPDDPRYQDLIGQHIILPLVGRKIPIVGDKHADMEKGTGCVKITPAHDFNDYEVGQRHQLPMIHILTENADIRGEAEVFNHKGEASDVYSSELPEGYHGLERFAARKRVVADIEALGLLDGIDDHALTVPYGDRSGVVIEPMLTDQWYVRTASLAQPAIEAVENGSIQFVPKQYENMYFSWMRDIQDWCISRQLWWGHRIPAWYDAEGKVYVGADEATVRQQYQLADDVVLVQDEDVLDTWFSSALWTFGTLGWPEQTPELKMFHPTDVLVTGFDIIFFWVARMIMMSLHFMKDEQGQPQVPFKTVYVTGLIRDENGDKMSKSKGNVLDPIDMIDGIDLESLVAKRTGNMMQPQLAAKIEKNTRKTFSDGIEPYGTDALRFTLAAMASTGRDINWDMKRLEGYRNFCNKLWNASRYALMNVQEQPVDFSAQADLALSPADIWITSLFELTAKEFNQYIDQYRLDMAANTLYEFIWNQFCDWYLELTKPILWKGTPAAQNAARKTLMTILEQTLRLAHPLIPYITESIWQSVKALMPDVTGDTIMTQPLPQYCAERVDAQVIAEIDWVKQLITCVRNLRAEYGISPAQPLKILLKVTAQDAERLKRNQAVLISLAKLESLECLAVGVEAPPSATALVGDSELLIPMAGFIDKEAELKRLAQEIAKVQGEIKRVNGKLSNDSFTAKAPESVVQQERDKLAQYQMNLQKLESNIVLIGNL